MSFRLGPPAQHQEAGFRNRAFRVGIVKQQDLGNAAVRVVFAEFDQLLSYWLPILAAKTQNDKSYWIPDLGEQVVCLMDERDEAGVVLGAIYSRPDSTPVQSADKFHLGFKDGAVFEYDRAAHVMKVALPSGAALDVTVNSATLTIDAGGSVVLNSKAGAVVNMDAAGDVILTPATGGKVIAG